LPLLVNGVSCWPGVEEEKEGIGISSDVFKVKGEDPAPPGCLREDRVSRYVGDSPSWVHTPWLAREENPEL